jgi:hypothetical protein
MAGKVDKQADRMTQDLARHGQDSPTRSTIPPEGESVKEPKLPNVRLSVYMAPDVADALEQAYLIRRLAGERETRSAFIEALLKEALKDQSAS